MLWVVPWARPTPQQEREHYATHDNKVEDTGYRRFLDRLAAPLTARVSAGARGLDYGCGPAPVLAMMLRERGFAMRVFDPFFAPAQTVLAERYDFITCTETAEHFHAPGRELQRLHALLRPGGWLAIMTQLVDARLSPSWWYLRDPTHVSFYSLATMHWVAQRFAWALSHPAPNVVLFRRA